MATDYDAPRKNDDEAESLDAIKERGAEKTSNPIDIDETDILDGGLGMNFGAISPEEVSLDTDVVLIPPQEDEFTCIKCFIVRHKSLRSSTSKAGSVCIECDS